MFSSWHELSQKADQVEQKWAIIPWPCICHKGRSDLGWDWGRRRSRRCGKAEQSWQCLCRLGPETRPPASSESSNYSSSSFLGPSISESATTQTFWALKVRVRSRGRERNEERLECFLVLSKSDNTI